ncbi:MAG: DNA processing protein DprA [Sulfurimonas sp. RIFOXYD12_FULL_33_39]|uniref:DNA-processing protein DprA n=1 Tax=unclassified Sulfurimonas TaxID=2623549 RepID=UPI0008C8943A|nr:MULTISPECIES: DNA-processing protein DprA [unclassified Sulfurimonas]OHE07649.1 MAG: DNA processing protein DprA [Sulfurimonas sp. RIFCSPLOWO2_12_FULL_34_6]OHE10547.1 MAG: DNA processing protein DprA [Sulfurimonas sp. RIFOXYD12_FULL_33_39]OHE15006.1 MAG: DNA processing protein DprA [Sulfurimonas sp. RIFOXYD2_FULL_34_21]DAB27764.1 MAG TPA: DNA processing protein DprA [Sulfurimonas sp. UBA10385]
MNLVQDKIPELLAMKNYPCKLFYDGNIELLKRVKVSIVGSRKPTMYSRLTIQKLSSSLSKHGVCIVSGGAMGIDATAHGAAGASNTIAVLPCGIDIRYPSVNKTLLNDISKNGLLISQFDMGFIATPWSFVVRNELVVALGDVLIVGEAEIDSGTMRSVEFALKMGKEIFVLPQRLGESSGTSQLLKELKAKPIYDIDEFVSGFATCSEPKIDKKEDDFFSFCAKNPTYDEACSKFPQRVFEAELGGEIKIANGRVWLL